MKSFSTFDMQIFSDVLFNFNFREPATLLKGIEIKSINIRTVTISCVVVYSSIFFRVYSSLIYLVLYLSLVYATAKGRK